MEETLRLTVMFAIPMATGLFTIARPLLYVLNPVYVEAVPVVRVLVVYALLMVLTNILDFIILGTERVDLNAESKFRDFAKSRLFLLPTINLAYGVSYLVTLGVVTYVALSSNLGADEVAFYWALTQLSVMLPFFTYKGLIARRIMRFKIPWRAVSLYLAASLLMVVILQLLKFEITYTPAIYVFIFDALRLVGVGIGIYFLVLYILDPYFRSLVRSTLASFRP